MSHTNTTCTFLLLLRIGYCRLGVEVIVGVLMAAKSNNDTFRSSCTHDHRSLLAQRVSRYYGVTLG
jgi:hypothetical protein